MPRKVSAPTPPRSPRIQGYMPWPRLCSIQCGETQVQEFTAPQPLVTFLDSNPHDVPNVSALTEDCVKVHNKLQPYNVLPLPNLNIFMGAFTTCHARPQLYLAIDHLGNRALYFDTDSVADLHSPNDPPLYPPHGAYLGEFKDELKPGDHIIEFSSGSLKNYGYKKVSSKTACKVCGSSLNMESHAQLN